MEIALIRHARPGRWIGDGPADPELNNTGREQTSLLVEHMTQTHAPRLTAIYSSTMSRAVQTAQPLAKRLNLQLHTDPDLVEYDYGMHHYVPTEEIDGDTQQYWDDLQSGWYGGQPLDTAKFQERVVSAIDKISVDHDDNDFIAIICHGGVISAYLSYVLDSRRIILFEPDYTSISRVLINRHGYRYLRSAGETPHLGFSDWNAIGRVI